MISAINLHARAAGVLLHVTSLPGPYGIGDFGPDAHRFVDWLAAAGQRVWQWLPTNPIGPCDSPYQSVSAFAGSPMMIALQPLVERGWQREPVDVPLFDARRVDYGQVVPWRMAQLRAAAQGFFAKASAAERQAFEAWRRRESYWLDNYALFMALETAHDGEPWWTWSPEYARRDPAALAEARTRLADEIAFREFVQWCFDTQLAALKRYANERGVALMGDLPIFVAHHSADCWARPDLYFLDEHFQPTVVAGVPPDGFAPTGQRWGNPLYRWDRMAAENFGWWTDRLRRMLDQADLFRIDHFRGFAGYWEVPASCPTAEVGQWVPGPGKPLFEAIERALGKLPIIAEDLGLITPDVIELRDAFAFPGMRIVQFAFSTDAADPFLPHNHAVDAVAYTGTHDNHTSLGWWDTAAPRERAYAAAYLGTDREGFAQALLRATWNSVARLAIAPMQDVLGLDASHRMNLPGSTVGNWAWRFDWPMVGDDDRARLAAMTAAAGRGPFDLLPLP
jgi:4-alpha-glucanotransferase